MIFDKMKKMGRAKMAKAKKSINDAFSGKIEKMMDKEMYKKTGKTKKMSGKFGKYL